MRKTRFLLLTVLILSAAVGWILSRNSQRDYSLTPPPPPDVVEPKPTQSSATEEPNGGPDREVVADGLQIPWEILFLPDGKLLVSERPGRLLLIGTDRHAIEVSGVRHVGEGGLLGLAMHPDF